MQKSAYIVWAPTKGMPFVEHKGFSEAQAEAERLCQLPENHGREFFILRAVQSVAYRKDPFVYTNYGRNL